MYIDIALAWYQALPDNQVFFTQGQPIQIRTFKPS